jgi:hypothetical protein
MPRTRPARSYRLPAETLHQIARIAEAREGLSATQVVVNAVDYYHDIVFPAGAETPGDAAPTRRRRDGRR